MFLNFETLKPDSRKPVFRPTDLRFRLVTLSTRSGLSRDLRFSAAFRFRASAPFYYDRSVPCFLLAFPSDKKLGRSFLYMKKYGTIALINVTRRDQMLSG